MGSETVSVVIPTYKGADNVSRAIKSAQEQTLCPVEILVVDDNPEGCPHREYSKKLRDQYQKSSSLVRFIFTSNNLGGSHARNLGIENATSNYIAFLDDDDFWFEEKLEKQVKILSSESPKIGAVSCGCTMQGFNNKVVWPAETCNPILDTLLLRINMATSTLVIRADVFEEIGTFDENFRRHQDIELLVRILDKYEIYALKEILVKRNVVTQNNVPDLPLLEHQKAMLLEKYSGIIDRLGTENEKRIVYFHHNHMLHHAIRSGDFRYFWTKFRKNPAATFTSPKSAIKLIKTLALRLFGYSGR